MALSSTVLKAAVKARILTQVAFLAQQKTLTQLQTEIWNLLFALGFREHGITQINPLTGQTYPTTRDVANEIARRVHAMEVEDMTFTYQLIDSVVDAIVEETVSHLQANAVVTVTGVQGGAGTANGTIS